MHEGAYGYLHAMAQYLANPVGLVRL